MSDISASHVEHVFGVATESARFTSLCNALIASKALSISVGYPVLSEKAGPDGSLDGEWTISADAEAVSGIGVPGWNVFQFKARGIQGKTRPQTISNLKKSLRGAARKLVARVHTANKTLSHYVLFTNLQLGLATSTRTVAGAKLSKDRQGLEAAIREGSDRGLKVTIIDAANLAAELNLNPALRLTYFGGGIAKTWDEKWTEEWKASGLDESLPLFGREDALKAMAGWLADDTVRVIAIDGANGMGKTRMALEMTRAHKNRTTVVEAFHEFERISLQTLATDAVPRIIILEDPDFELAQRVAKQVIAQSRLKLIITLPSRDKAPWFSVTDSDVKYHSLAPLTRDPAAKLLKAAGPDIDSDASDWILQSAGGIPFVILNAAKFGNELREKVGTLKQFLAQKFHLRIEKELGPDALEALRLISPLQWTLITGEKSELRMLTDLFRSNLAVTRTIDLIGKMVRMGFARIRGDFATVNPPIFASSLGENVFAAQPAEIRVLFDRSDDDGRRRLLERIVTLELGDFVPFWKHVFKFCGANPQAIVAHSALFHTLARANPVATAQCLESNIQGVVQIRAREHSDSKIGQLTSATRELMYHSPTCATGMRIMQSLALAFPESSAAKRFNDAFVHWFYSFPLTYADRIAWLRRLLASTSLAERELGSDALEHATSIPHTLSGYEVTARRIGTTPVSRLWTEVHDYLESLFFLRLQLLADSATSIASRMAGNLTKALTRLTEYIPAERLVKILSAYMQLYREGVAKDAPVDVRRLIEFTTTSYSERREAADVTIRALWDPLLAQLEIWRKEFDDGPFELRFKLTVARAHDWEEVEFEGRKMYTNEMRCRLLARDVIDDPALMSENLWQLSETAEAWTFHPFVAALCEYDATHGFLPILESRALHLSGERNLATYLHVLSQNDLAFATARFNALLSVLPKSAMLAIMDMFQHPPEHRHLLLQWIAEGSVSPKTVGESLSRRSMQNVPSGEIATILEYVSTGENTDLLLLNALSSFVHRDKPLPQELFPLALRLLKSIRPSNNAAYQCSVVAIAISRAKKDVGFVVFREQMIALQIPENYTVDLWNPLGRFDAHNFWEHLVSTWPEDSYLTLLELEKIDFNDVWGPLLNLREHTSILLRLSADLVSARFFAARLGGSQTGFFDFAFALLTLHPSDATLAAVLRTSAMSENFDHSFDTDHHRQVETRIDSQLKVAGLPILHRSWLESAREKARAGRKEEERIWGSIDRGPGWDE